MGVLEERKLEILKSAIGNVELTIGEELTLKHLALHQDRDTIEKLSSIIIAAVNNKTKTNQGGAP
ncbi:MAG: hypothetical protein FH749_06975 [Firmicutes bacterium]|nr:hypothetical protein [Bacillota bacterium]